MLLNLLYLLLMYLSIVFLWFVINTVGYFFSIALNKPAISNTISGLSVLLLYLLNFLIGIYLLVYSISLLLNGEFLWFLFYIFIGFGLFSWMVGLMQLPFTFIASFYMTKIESFNFVENIATAEVLDSNNKVVSIIKGDTTISIRLAKYFSSLYVFNLFSLVLGPEREFYVNNWSDYLTKPFLWILSYSVIVGLPYLIFYRIKHKNWLPEDRRLFFISVWRITLFIMVPVALLLFIVLPLFVQV